VKKEGEEGEDLIPTGIEFETEGAEKRLPNFGYAGSSCPKFKLF